MCLIVRQEHLGKTLVARKGTEPIEAWKLLKYKDYKRTRYITPYMWTPWPRGKMIKANGRAKSITKMVSDIADMIEDGVSSNEACAYIDGGAIHLFANKPPESAERVLVKVYVDPRDIVAYGRFVDEESLTAKRVYPNPIACQKAMTKKGKK